MLKHIAIVIEALAGAFASKGFDPKPNQNASPPSRAAGECSERVRQAFDFLPVTVLQQLHTPAGCEGSAFTLMQAGGTLGTVIGRNFEWQLLRWCGVDMSLGAAGFSNFSAVLVVAGVWRATTALVLCLVLLPRLDAQLSQRKRFGHVTGGSDG